MRAIFDRNFDVELGAEFSEGLFHRRERKVFLQRRRPCAGRRMSDVSIFFIDRHSATPRRERDLRRQSDLVK